MDRVIVAEKLESLRRCMARVREKAPKTPDSLASDADLQDILVLNLTRAVQLCVDIGLHIISDANDPAPGTMGEVFTRLSSAGVIDSTLAESMRKAVGFRNVAIHNYEAIDWQIVHAIATSNVEDFARFARAVAERL